jgi:hypothetical protein
MKVVESSAVFQPKQRTEKREAVTTANQSKTGPNPIVPNQASKSTIVRGAHKTELADGRSGDRGGSDIFRIIGGSMSDRNSSQ